MSKSVVLSIGRSERALVMDRLGSVTTGVTYAFSSSSTTMMVVMVVMVLMVVMVMIVVMVVMVVIVVMVVLVVIPARAMVTMLVTLGVILAKTGTFGETSFTHPQMFAT